MSDKEMIKKLFKGAINTPISKKLKQLRIAYYNAKNENDGNN